LCNLDFTIHLVTQATVSLLDDVDEDVFDHPVNPVLLREFLGNSSNALLVATKDGQVIGMATGMVYVHPDKPRSLFINEVGVATGYQQRGIGSRLVATILEWGKSQGCAEAWVATEVGNTAARSLYKSTGGIEDDEHAVVYVFDLANEPAEPDQE
jgi:ribosomal protein S18 acetylase RimI-like enzyme